MKFNKLINNVRLFSKKTEPLKVAKNIYIKKKNWEFLTELCEQLNMKPSNFIDGFIEMMKFDSETK